MKKVIIILLAITLTTACSVGKKNVSRNQLGCHK